MYSSERLATPSSGRSVPPFQMTAGAYQQMSVYGAPILNSGLAATLKT